MNLILLSGGSGKRLWPLSNDIRSKQFLKLFKNKDGIYESMVQRIYNQIKSIDKNSNIVVATSKNQVSQIHNQLGDNVDICIEPCRKNTFPAIVLATLYLHEIKNIDKDDAIIVCPVDPYVDETYFETLKKMYDFTKTNASNLNLIGVKPTYPSEKFGYIIPQDNAQISKVLCFKEKPDEQTAKKYIENNALWNAGVFSFKVDYLLKKAHELIEFKDYNDLYNKYESLEKISFDYAVSEKEKSISVMRYNGLWEDLGTWNSFSNYIEEKNGKVILDDESKNVNIINELNIPVLAVGLNNIVVASSLDGILVANKDKVELIKKYTDNINDDARYAEYDWGNYKIIDYEKKQQIKKITINANKQMKYIYKNKETLVVLSGSGFIENEKGKRKIINGDSVIIDSNCVITSLEELVLLAADI